MIPKNQDHAYSFLTAVNDGRSTVNDNTLGAVPGYQDGIADDATVDLVSRTF